MPLPNHQYYFASTNGFGTVVLNFKNVKEQNSAEQITQVTRYGEIWGVDTRAAASQDTIQFGEKTIAQVLSGYLSFARDQLGLQAPLKIIAGFTGVQGFAFHHPMKPQVYWGPEASYCNTADIVWEGKIHDLTADTTKVLLPFFDTVWDACGLDRAAWFPEEYHQTTDQAPRVF